VVEVYSEQNPQRGREALPPRWAHWLFPEACEVSIPEALTHHLRSPKWWGWSSGVNPG
jgi:hypothetical protein